MSACVQVETRGHLGCCALDSSRYARLAGQQAPGSGPLGLPSHHCWDDAWLAYTIELRSSRLPTLFHLSHFPSPVLSSHMTQLFHFSVFIQSQHITETLAHPCQLQPCSQQQKSGTNLGAHQQRDRWGKCGGHTQWDFPVIKKDEVMSFAERWA